MDPQTQSSLLHALRVLASINKQDRIGTQGSIYLESGNSLMVALSRWYYGESRTTNFEMIEKILKDALDLCEKLLENREMLLKNNAQDLTLLENSQLLTRFQAEIKGALMGTANLATTYADDASAVARLFTMNQTARNHLQRISLHFQKLVEPPNEE
uniref:Uncharacterized protein n=1 Tax=viral metagenome TaxID=1070528 RepID=A0A6C0BNW8_9ZZZZ